MLGLHSKLMGQVSLARIAKDHLRDGGSIVLTTGVLAMHPMLGSASISMVNAGRYDGVDIRLKDGALDRVYGNGMNPDPDGRGPRDIPHKRPPDDQTAQS